MFNNLVGNWRKIQILRLFLEYPHPGLVKVAITRLFVNVKKFFFFFRFFECTMLSHCYVLEEVCISVLAAELLFVGDLTF